MFSGPHLSPFLAYIRLLHRLSLIEGRGSMAIGSQGLAVGLPPTATTAVTFGVVIAVALVVRFLGRGLLGLCVDRACFSMAIVACIVVSPIVWSHYFLLLAVALVIIQPELSWVTVSVFAVSWFVTPDRRWPFSPSAYVPSIGRGGYWLAQILLVAAVAMVVALPVSERRRIRIAQSLPIGSESVGERAALAEVTQVRQS